MCTTLIRIQTQLAIPSSIVTIRMLNKWTNAEYI